MDQRNKSIVLAGLAAAAGLAAGAFLAFSFAKSRATNAKTEGRKSGTDPFAHLPKRIILVRHGESEGNADKTHKIYSTKADNLIELTSKGHDQAKRAGKRIRELVGEGDVGFCVSPFRRTIETMQGIYSAWNFPRASSARKSGWIHIHPALREQEFGNLQGDDFQTFRAEQKKVGRFFYRFPTGESGADLYDRTKLWWHMEVLNMDIHETERAENLVIVTHGLTMRVILMMLSGWSPHTFSTVWNADNCDVYVLDRIKLKPGATYWRTPFELNKELSDGIRSSCPITVHLKDGSCQNVVLNHYLSIPAPRTRQINFVKKMLQQQHGIDPDSVSHIDMYNGKFKSSKK